MVPLFILISVPFFIHPQPNCFWFRENYAETEEKYNSMENDKEKATRKEIL